jgi:hypothetical protein
MNPAILSLALALVLPSAVLSSVAAKAEILPAIGEGWFGPYPQADYRPETGACRDCRVIPQALWYFQGEAIAVPRAGVPMAKGAPGKPVALEASGLRLPDDPAKDPRTPLIWLGSALVVPEARLDDAGSMVSIDGKVMPFAYVPRLRTNLSWRDETTDAFFAGRAVRLRGEMERGSDGAERFVARTVWPKDFVLDPSASMRPLAAGESLETLVSAQDGDGARASFSTRVLWSRHPGAPIGGASVVGFMLNGAQGDDDEAHGGHFGVATGRWEPDGDMSSWLVNNFYGLDSYGEKGILAAATPMDKYLADLNNGQSYYRPSSMLVAVFRTDRAARAYQGAMGGIYDRFYRHDLVYDHARSNCSGISVDAFRGLGWNVPDGGTESLAKRIGAYGYVLGTTGSPGDARKIYDYFSAERSRLYPASAFVAMGGDLLAMAEGRLGREPTDFERGMAEDLVAIVHVAIPQLPSDRAWGRASVFSFDEYMRRTPADRSKWKIIPVDPKPFPASLRDADTPVPEKPFPLPLPVGLTLVGLFSAIAVGIRFVIRRRSAGKA